MHAPNNKLHLQLMHDNNILSVPVINHSTAPANTLGFVDMFDVLSYLIESWDEVMDIIIVN